MEQQQNYQPATATDPCYNAIVYMNNTGISLLRRGLCSEAMDTLKEGMQILNMSYQDKAWPAARVEQALSLASKRMALPFDDEDRNNLVLISTDQQESPITLYHRLQQQGSAPFGLTMGSLIEEERLLLDLMSTILLYNYALANWFFAETITTTTTTTTTTGQSPERTAKAWYNTYRLFRLAESVVSHFFCCGRDCSQETTPPPPSCSVLLVSLLISVCLARVSVYVDDGSADDESNFYQNALAELLHFIAKQESMLPTCGVSSAAAAA